MLCELLRMPPSPIIWRKLNLLFTERYCLAKCHLLHNQGWNSKREISTMATTARVQNILYVHTILFNLRKLHTYKDAHCLGYQERVPSSITTQWDRHPRKRELCQRHTKSTRDKVRSKSKSHKRMNTSYVDGENKILFLYFKRLYN